MPGYAKLFSSILTSTIWCADSDTKVVWITLLASANRKGIVEGTIPGLAKLAGVPDNKTREAIDKLLRPDPESRTKDKNGCRIEAIPGGWRLVNYEKYRDTLTAEQGREYERLRKQNYRTKLLSRTVPDLSLTTNYQLATPKLHGDKRGGVGGREGDFINSQSRENQKPKTKLKECPVPGCRNPVPAGDIYCSDLHKQWAENELKRGKA